MQFPMTIGLHRSFFGGLAIAVMHFLAAVVILLTPWVPVIKVALIAGVAGSVILARVHLRQMVDSLRLSDDGRLECRLVGTGVFVEAGLAVAATVHPWLTVLPLKIGDKKHVVLVLPDSIHSDDFRRLRIWLRWRANFNGAKNAA